MVLARVETGSITPPPWSIVDVSTGKVWIPLEPADFLSLVFNVPCPSSGWYLEVPIVQVYFLCFDRGFDRMPRPSHFAPQPLDISIC